MGAGLESATRDVRVALRGWLRAPGFVAAAVTTLALGIGANTAVFSAFYAVMVRPLPFTDSDRVVYIAGPAAPSDPSVPTWVLPMVDIPRLRAESKTLSSISVLMLADAPVQGVRDGETVEMRQALISPEVFELMGVQPALGRLFGPHDEGEGAERVAIVSYATWQDLFAGDPNLVGRRITTAGYVQTIVGVMPRGFAFPSPDFQMWSVAELPSVLVERASKPADAPTIVGPRSTEAGTPSQDTTSKGRGRSESASRTDVDSGMTAAMVGRMTAPTIARINPGVALETATAEVNTLFLSMHPELAPAIARGMPPPIRLMYVKDVTVAPVRAALLMLAAAAALVLFIACSNVAWLLLARAIGRRNEIGVRIALGASGGRVIREVLTESVMLALFGGLAGILLAILGLQLLRVLHGDMLPRLAEVHVDGAFLLISVASSVVTVVVAGVLPGIRIARFRLVPLGREAVADGAVTGGALGRESASVLTIAQVGSAVVLLITAGLLLRSFVGLARLDLGYDPDRVLTCRVRMPPNHPTAEQSRIFSQLLERLGAVPGVVAVATTGRLPTRPGGVASGLLQLPGTPTRVPVNVTPASATYPEVMRLRVTAGRWFDRQDQPGGQVAIVISQQVAASFPDGRAIDSLVQLNGPWEGIPLHIVGVVENTLTGGLDSVLKPDVYVSLDQWPAELPSPLRSAFIAIRHNDAPMALAPIVRNLVSQIEPSASVDQIVSMQELVSRNTERPFAYAALLGTFAVVAVVIALVGIYGFVAYIVSARSYEIGVRMALGARQGQILRLVLGSSVTVTVVGVVLGLVAAAATTRYLKAMLFGLTPLDVMTFVGVTVTFVAVAILAAYGPARRATTVDPLVSLRSE